MAISTTDLQLAFESLRAKWELETDSRKDPDPRASSRAWSDVQVRDSFGANYLRITRELPSGTFEKSIDQWDEEIEELDDEALLATVQHVGTRKVIYDIVHSASYQVPVLYITFFQSQASTPGPPLLEEAYSLLVPTTRKPQLKEVGVLGALSMTEHPITGLPAYFVHPCRTQEAMSAISGEMPSTPEIYLMRWFGIIGASVGLDVPVEAAFAIAGTQSAPLLSMHQLRRICAFPAHCCFSSYAQQSPVRKSGSFTQ